MGKCVTVASVGDACDAANGPDCGIDAVCTNGKCVEVDATICN